MNREELDAWFDPIYESIIDPITESKVLRFQAGTWEEKEAELNNINIEQIKDSYIPMFYSTTESWKCHWKTNEDVGFNAEGIFDFLPLKRVMLDSWDNDLGGNDWAPDMKGFRPLDMFYDMDGFVGFYIGRPEKKGLYLQHSDSSVSALHVDLDGYLQLLGMSKGFGWWQNALVQISTGQEMPNVASFKEKMPKIFPDFSWDAFVELYESVRIDK